MKVLFLTRYPYEGASSRYRVYQYIPHLEKLGVDCRVSSFMSADFYRLSFSNGRMLAKMVATLRATLGRLAELLRFHRYDVIYMQREMFPFGPPVIEWVLKRFGARLIFDYDDALFIHKPSRYNNLASLFRSSGKTYHLFALADCVIAGNDYLRDVTRQHGPRAETVEVAEDTDRIPMHPPHSNEKGVVIGWLGSKSTVKYLRLIEDVLKNISRTYPFVRFEIVGGGDFDLGDLPVTHTEWSLDGEINALKRFDIGLMPLPMEEWSRGKSGGKARTYMAAGVPPICTNIGYNTELLHHGETGYLCETTEEWHAALSSLIEDPSLRQRIGQNARTDVIHRFPLKGQAARIAGILAEIAGKKLPVNLQDGDRS